MGQLSIFSGAFGSGKTEIAINYALERTRRTEYNEVLLADLDTANPYFVARDARDLLGPEGKAIRVIAPIRELAQADVPNLPQEIIGLLRADNDMVLDLAGDKFGALVLGYISRYIRAREHYQLYMVINPYRPFASTLDEVMELRTLLERAGRIEFNGIISNPNLVEETSVEVIKEGHRRVVGFAQKLELPVAYLAVKDKYYQELYPEYGNDLKSIKLYLRPEWIRGLEEGTKDGEGQG